MHTVYVLYSDQQDRLYIGMTSDLTRRIRDHNAGYNESTKAYVPWRLIHTEEFIDRVTAREKEKKLKTTSGRRYIRNHYL